MSKPIAMALAAAGICLVLIGVVLLLLFGPVKGQVGFNTALGFIATGLIVILAVTGYVTQGRTYIGG